MSRMDPLNALASHGPIIPVMVIERLGDAVPMAEALMAGGVRVLEVTLRTPAALAALEAIAKAVPEVVLGAGTLRTAADAVAARNAGCLFGVSPGFTEHLSFACRDAGLPLLPGVSSASEVMRANDAGHRFLKLFPDVAVGGVAMLQGLAGPFPDVTFCPTGGISIKNAAEFLSLPNVSVCGGTWLTPRDAIAAGDWARITRLAREAQALSSRLDGKLLE